MFFHYVPSPLEQPTYIYSQYNKYTNTLYVELYTHPLCQKCYIISLSQQIIEIFILYDWSHDDFKCLYYSVRGRKQCPIVLQPCAIISPFQLNWPGRCCISYTDWPHWNTVNNLHYIHSDLWPREVHFNTSGFMLACSLACTLVPSLTHSLIRSLAHGHLLWSKLAVFLYHYCFNYHQLAPVTGLRHTVFM